jgi:hypothetical protein
MGVRAPHPRGAMSIEHEGAHPARRQRDRRRPSWVWLIGSYYISAGLWSLAIYWQLYTHRLSLLPPSTRIYFDNYTGADYGVLMGLSALGICAAIALLMLRRASVYLFAARFMFSALLAIYGAFHGGALDTSRPGYVLAGLVLWSVSAGVCFYAWHLLRKGVLK